MKKNSSKITSIDLRELYSILLSNLNYIIGFTVLGLLLGFFVVSSVSKDSYRITTEIVFDEIKLEIIEKEFDIVIADRFPVIVNTYILPDLAESSDIFYPFSVMEGGQYQTKLISIIDLPDRNEAKSSFEKLSNLIKSHFEEDVYSLYMNDVNNVEHYYSKKRDDFLEENLDFINKNLTDNTPENIAISFLLGALNEKLISTSQTRSDNTFFSMNDNFDDYVSQLSMNGIFIDEPSVLFRQDQNTQIVKMGEEFNFSPLIGALLGLFLSIVLIIFIKSNRYAK
tara:strand:- start:1517 stop:2365 length:849 start_codon:yes stop_codon:yes gene_type:complete